MLLVETTDTSVSGSRVIVFAVRDGMVDLRRKGRRLSDDFEDDLPA